jgi:hypothetical protein
MANAAFLADARLVLEEQAEALIFVRMLNFFRKRLFQDALRSIVALRLHWQVE